MPSQQNSEFPSAALQELECLNKTFRFGLSSFAPSHFPFWGPKVWNLDDGHIGIVGSCVRETKIRGGKEKTVVDSDTIDGLDSTC